MFTETDKGNRWST